MPTDFVTPSRRAIFPILFLLFLASSVPSFSAEIPPTRVAVLQFSVKGEGVNAGSGEILADLLTSELQAGNRYDLVERLQVDQVTAEATRQGGGLVDPSTAVQIGRQLGARIVVAGAVYKTGGIVVASGRFLDVETAQVILSQTASGASGAGLLPLARELASSLKKHEETDAKERLGRARTLQKRRRVERALKEYEAIVGKYPRSSVADDAVYYRGKAYFDEGEYYEAVASFDDLMDTYIESPFNEDALFYTAEARYFSAFGNPARVEDAIRNYRVWLEKYRKETNAREKIISRAQVAKDARADYELLLDLYPKTKYKNTIKKRLDEIGRHGGL